MVLLFLLRHAGDAALARKEIARVELLEQTLPRHELLVDELVHRQRAELTPDAGALDAAEGQVLA